MPGILLFRRGLQHLAHEAGEDGGLERLVQEMLAFAQIQITIAGFPRIF